MVDLLPMGSLILVNLDILSSERATMSNDNRLLVAYLIYLLSQ